LFTTSVLLRGNQENKPALDPNIVFSPIKANGHHGSQGSTDLDLNHSYSDSLAMWRAPLSFAGVVRAT
jgi:hypothetical protein